MPFTPFHLGAAVLGKGLAPKAQSVLFFGFCTLAIDLEPAIKMAVGFEGSLHDITHHPLGLFATAALCGVIWWFSQKQRWWGHGMPVLTRKQLLDTGWWAAASHWLLDSMSHADIPGSWSHWSGMEEAQAVAIGMAVLGLLLLAVRWAVVRTIGAVRAHRASADR